MRVFNKSSILKYILSSCSSWNKFRKGKIYFFPFFLYHFCFKFSKSFFNKHLKQYLKPVGILRFKICRSNSCYWTSRIFLSFFFPLAIQAAERWVHRHRTRWLEHGYLFSKLIGLIMERWELCTTISWFFWLEIDVWHLNSESLHWILHVKHVGEKVALSSSSGAGTG